MRLAYLVSHPIQYQAPLLRRIAAEPEVDLTVLFGSDFSVRGYEDPGFGREIAWDVPLLEGYQHEFLPSLRDTGSLSLTSPISTGIYRHLRTLQPDALWVHGYASINALHGILAARALGIPVLLRAESWLADRTRGPLKLALKRLFFGALGTCTAAVLPIGTRNAAYWSHYLPNTPQFLMPYAVDNAWFGQQAQLANASELNIPPGRPVILFASKLQPRKNAADLLHAFHQLLENQPSPSPDQPFLLIAGDGDQRSALESLASTLRLTDHVRFLGFRNQTELPRLFRLASVFVLPSRHEPWGLIVNESLACGCPVIVSSDVGCAPDLVPDLNPNHITGLTYPVGDIPALASALREILSRPIAPLRAAALAHISTWGFEQDIAALHAALAHVVA